MVTGIPPTAGGHYAMRVLAASSTAAPPYEVRELAACDMVVDDSGPGVGEPRLRVFGTAVEDGLESCNPAFVAQAVWGFGTPDVLVSHDASTASLVFGPAVTRNLPWISLHRVARRLWPHCPAEYTLESLSKWRAEVGRTDALCGAPKRGAAREAHLTAALLAEMLTDPSLRAAGQPVDCSDVERYRRLGLVLLDAFRYDALQSALRISTLPSPPLQYVPGPWDDDAAWSRVGTEDLRWVARHGRLGYPEYTQAAARAELGRRARAAAGAVPRRQPVILRRTSPPHGVADCRSGPG